MNGTKSNAKDTCKEHAGEPGGPFERTSFEAPRIEAHGELPVITAASFIEIQI